MIQNREELFTAMNDAGLPQNLRRIWDSDIPEEIQYSLQDPSMFFEAFLAHPDGFPSPDELVILWQTNGDSITGYLQKTGIYIRNYLEDGPDEIQVLGSTYQQMISEVVSNLLMREKPETKVKTVAEFLEFKYLTELQHFIKTNPAWEENTATFIATLE